MLALCPTSTPVVDPADRGFFLGRRMVGANWMDILLTLGSAGGVVALGFVLLILASRHDSRRH